MRAYLHIVEGVATLHLPATSNRPADAIPFGFRPSGRADGWYRASARYDRGWDVNIGKRVDPHVEAARLEKLADEGGKGALTSSPGIAGFVQRELASGCATRTQQQISRHFAGLLTLAGKFDS